MVLLKKSRYAIAFQAYRETDPFFPLIGAVLQGRQDGLVFADCGENAGQYYVEHAFGFAQVFGDTRPFFEIELEKYLLIDRRFAVPKIRLYTPKLLKFFDDVTSERMRAWRQRFILDCGQLPALVAIPPDLDVVDVSRGNVLDIERQFGVISRFWRSPDDFIRSAHASVICHKGRLASICYAAAESDGRAEIDVLTLPEYRTLGIGKLAVMLFSKECCRLGIEPLWDCFVNNSGSMQLCQSVGFRAPRPPYPFFTINKNVD